MGGGLESRCVGRVNGADGAVHGTIRTTFQVIAFVQNDNRNIIIRSEPCRLINLLCPLRVITFNTNV
jgi:hypothetical protein